MQQIANFIVDHDPMMVLQRTHDTVRYIRWAWNKDHADPINKEISAMTKKQQADLDDSQPAERRCLFDVLSFGSNACSFARECNADFYN